MNKSYPKSRYLLFELGVLIIISIIMAVGIIIVDTPPSKYTKATARHHAVRVI